MFAKTTLAALALSLATISAASAGTVVKQQITTTDEFGNRVVKSRVSATDEFGDRVSKTTISRTDEFGNTVKITRIKRSNDLGAVGFGFGRGGFIRRAGF